MSKRQNAYCYTYADLEIERGHTGVESGGQDLRIVLSACSGELANGLFARSERVRRADMCFLETFGGMDLEQAEYDYGVRHPDLDARYMWARSVAGGVIGKKRVWWQSEWRVPARYVRQVELLATACGWSQARRLVATMPQLGVVVPVSRTAAEILDEIVRMATELKWRREPVVAQTRFEGAVQWEVVGVNLPLVVGRLGERNVTVVAAIGGPFPVHSEEAMREQKREVIGRRLVGLLYDVVSKAWERVPNVLEDASGVVRSVVEGRAGRPVEEQVAWCGKNRVVRTVRAVAGEKWEQVEFAFRHGVTVQSVEQFLDL